MVNEIDPNYDSQFENEWRILMEPNGGIPKCLNVANLRKAILSKVILVMVSVNVIVNIVKKLNSSIPTKSNC